MYNVLAFIISVENLGMSLNFLCAFGFHQFSYDVARVDFFVFICL